MQQSWERFYRIWLDEAFPAGSPLDPGALRAQRVAGATSAAARETVRHLREEAGWSLVNASILVGRFVETADQWMEHGRDPAHLRDWLRAAWAAEQAMHAVEHERRTATEALLAGSRFGSPALPAECIAELAIW